MIDNFGRVGVTLYVSSFGEAGVGCIMGPRTVESPNGGSIVLFLGPLR